MCSTSAWKQLCESLPSRVSDTKNSFALKCVYRHHFLDLLSRGEAENQLKQTTGQELSTFTADEATFHC